MKKIINIYSRPLYHDKLNAGIFSFSQKMFGLLVLLIFVSINLSFGQTNYYSAAAGNLNVLGTWGTNTDGSGANPANFTSANQIFNIRNRAAHTINYAWTVSGAGSKVVVGDGTNPCVITMTTAPNWVATDISNNATIINQIGGTYGTLNVLSGGTYNHARNGGTIPTATWNAASNCNVTGIVNTLPSGIGQSFGNFTWNCTGQNSNLNWDASPTFNGTFTVSSTGTNDIRIARTADQTINVNNFSLTGGTLTLARGPYTCNMNVLGNFSISNGTIWTTASAGTGIANINFNKAGTQNFSKTGGAIGGRINFYVNSGSIFNLGTNIIDASGGSTVTFTLNNGASIILGDPNGITSTGTASGSVQVTSTRVYGIGANYIYNGSSAQNTGNGLPATVSNLTVNNASSGGLSLTASVSISGTCLINSGATLHFNNRTVTGSTFSLSAGGTIIIDDAAGITSSGATGNV